MRLERKFELLLSILLLATVALLLWGRKQSQSDARALPSPPSGPARANPPSNASRTAHYPLLTPPESIPAARLVSGHGDSAMGASAPAQPADPRFPRRLTNTPKSIEELARTESALLLGNAFIETTRPAGLPIPSHLRSSGDPGGYLVQSRGQVGAAFRSRLRSVEASIISYIPNNAYLVTLSPEGAERLKSFPETQAVLPFEPYYKLHDKLLALAVDHKPLPEGGWLRLTLFPGERDSAFDAVRQLGGEVVFEEPSPFGPQMVIQPELESLPVLAGLASVQGIEPYYGRELLNDQVRVTVGQAGTMAAVTNYLGLSGSNIVVNLNDSGLDASHPDFQGRVFAADPKTLNDREGHGTHVAGTIGASGGQSGSAGSPDSSGPGASFRGMAPNAKFFVLTTSYQPGVQGAVSDTYLQVVAARSNAVHFGRGNAPLISNNSWGNIGANEYDSSSARFDAAVRDALPEMAGPHPVIYVFAAGNSGEGDDNGLGGESGTVTSPASAKNVIAVGAIEQMRNITNLAVIRETNTMFDPQGMIVTNFTFRTNAPFLGATDSRDQVVAFSSRGNVGIGIEGQFGRFKPDVVAPGSFVISARSKEWSLDNVVDEENGELPVLREVNPPLGPHYRYESGTSMAAPVVSGMLALMQEFFEQRGPAGTRRTNSPALMKAMIIHGARSAGQLYDLQVQSLINYQGWGLVNLSNTLPAILATQPEPRWPIQLIDQHPTNSVATGQVRSWNVALSTNAQQVPFRVTLVWTDPPGNPNAAIKLVNDLDLVVSNTVSGQVFIGNNIPVSSDFTPPHQPESAPLSDVVNNVENVFIRDPFSSNFVVSVIGKRVNVGAVTGFHSVTAGTNDVVQDFALVISSGDLTLTNSLTVTPLLNPEPLPRPEVLSMTNGLPLFNQRVGAQPKLFNKRDGRLEQWNFFTFTNTFLTNDFVTLTNGTNVAFITFIPPNLGQPRIREADIDLYVSTDPKLLDLDAASVETALKSNKRGGTEFVALTNAALDQVFYIAVKAEDAEGAEYGLIAISTDEPFETLDDGNPVLRGFPVRALIPDGTANDPGGVQVLALGLTPNQIQRVIVTNVITHENLGDLIGILSHDRTSVALNNHSADIGSFFGTHFFVYDDNPFRRLPGSRRTDGPGTLNDFVGQEGSGVWMLNMVDNSPTHTGRVESLAIRVETFQNRNLNDAGPQGITATVAPNDVSCFNFEVAPEATNMIVRLSKMTGPLQVLIRREEMPTTNLFDKAVSLAPPGGDATLSTTDLPLPLLAGRYFICVFNPSTFAAATFNIVTFVELGPEKDSNLNLASTNILTLIDEGVTTSTLQVLADKHLVDLSVGLRIDHPRPSDLTVHLITPQGTRLLLTENRGGMTPSGYGDGFNTNTSFTVFTELTNLFENLLPVKFATPPYTNFLTGLLAPPVFTNGFEGVEPGQFSSNEVFAGWRVTHGRVQVHGLTNTLGSSPGAGPVLPESGTNLLELDTVRSPAGVLQSFGTIPGRDYQLGFAYRRNPVTRRNSAHALQVYYGPPLDFRPASKFIAVSDSQWLRTNVVFRAVTSTSVVELGSVTSAGPLVDNVVVTELVPTTNTYVLPEESLDLVEGERTIGEWTLEVKDNRKGPDAVGNPALLAWQLQLKYGEPRSKAIVLTNGLSFSGVLTNNQTNYFIVDVCDTTKQAISILTGEHEKLVLLGDRSGLPTGDMARDDYSFITNNFVIDPQLSSATFGSEAGVSHPAPLRPGKPFFLAVHSLDPDETNRFTIQVDFDRDECHGERPIQRLVHDEPLTNTIPPITSLFNHYVFSSSCNAATIDFVVAPRNGDVGLVARRGPVPPLPDKLIFDNQSDLPGVTNEIVVITTNTAPVFLTPGDDWYVGVYNNSTNAVTYTIRAREFSMTGGSLSETNFITLTNAEPVLFFQNLCPQVTNYFVFSVTNPVPAINFELLGTNEDVDLLIGYNEPPSLNKFFLSNSVIGTFSTQVIIATNQSLRTLEGDWFLRVVGRVPTRLRFTVLGEIRLDVEPPPPSTNLVYISPRVQVGVTTLCLGWDTIPGRQYQVRGLRNVDDRQWDPLSPVLRAEASNLSHCLDLPTPYQFFQVIQFPQPVQEPPPPVAFITPRLQLTETTLCLSWDSQAGTNYVVRAKEDIEAPSWDLLSGVITGTGPTAQHCVDLPTRFRFFQIAIVTGQPPPTTPPPVSFVTPKLELTQTNLCLTWESRAGTNYVVQGKENIGDLAWEAVSPNITAAGSSSQFCVPMPTRFHFFRIAVVGGEPGPPAPPVRPFLISSALSVNSTNVCLSWASQAGVTYHIDGRAELAAGSWTRLPQSVRASADVSTYCVPLPSPYRFFRIVADSTGAPPPGGPVTLQAPVVMMDGRLGISWEAEIGRRYELQVTADVAAASWTSLTNVVANQRLMTITDPSPAADASARFYRVRQVTQP